MAQPAGQRADADGGVARLGEHPAQGGCGREVGDRNDVGRPQKLPAAFALLRLDGLRRHRERAGGTSSPPSDGLDGRSCFDNPARLHAAVLRSSLLQGAYLAVYCTFAGTFAESLIIDSEHWRHFYLIIGMLWGLMLASRRYVATPRVAPVPAALAPQRRPALSTGGRSVAQPG